MVSRPIPDSAVFAALADETRISLVTRLQQAPAMSTLELTRGTGMSRQAVRKHLGVLAEAGLVRDRRVGRQRMWELDAGPLQEVSDWAAAVRRVWQARLDRLDAFLLSNSQSVEE